MIRAPQPALPLARADRYLPADFLAAPSNAAALTWIERDEVWPGRRLALWGPAGCGKTHLLHVWASRTGAAVLGARELAGAPPHPAWPALAIDDGEQAASGAALLHWLNEAAEAGAPVLLASRAAPARWAVALPDLQSRLRAITAVAIMPPEEELLRAVLARLFVDRGLAVSRPVQDWLLARLPRTGAALRSAAARLDEAGLAAGSPITRALAAATLGDLLDNAAEQEHEMSGPARSHALVPSGHDL